MMFIISVIKRRMISKLRLGMVVTAAALVATGCGEDKLDSELLGNFTLDVPIAYVKRPVETLANPRNSQNFQPGGNLWLREYASSTAPEKNLTAEYTKGCADPANAIEGDVSDPDVSYDGKKIVFAMRLGNAVDCSPDVDELLTWNIFEYDIETGQILPVISSGTPILDPTANYYRNIKREEGNDIDPTYLPDGRIVFSSDRLTATKQANLLDFPLFSFDDVLSDEGGRNQREPTMNLHVMAPGDNNSIKQITFNQSHDLNPSVLQNGKIIYSRWEQAYNSRNQFDLYQVNPDGTEQELVYGSHSHDTTAGSEAVFFYPHEYPGSPRRILTTLMPLQDTFEGGDLVYIDIDNFVEINVPKVTSGSSSSTGQSSATGGDIPLTVGNSANGRYTTPFPLWDNTNRALVAWAPCMVILANGSPEFCTIANDTNLPPAPAEYGIWIYDLAKNAQRHIVFPDPGFTITDPVAVINRDEALNTPAVIPDKDPNAGELDDDLVQESKGLIIIKSVYDTDSLAISRMRPGTIANGGDMLNNEFIPCVVNSATPSSVCGDAGQSPNLKTLQGASADTRIARFLRIIRPAPIIDIQNDRPQDMRQILGYIPIEPDGSVVAEVPANRPFAIEVLGADGQKIQKLQIHNSWLQLVPGETKVCNGCHSSRNGQPALNSGATNSETISGFTGTMLHSDPNQALKPNLGETMAETRARVSCNSIVNTCASRKLLPSIVYDDVWQDPENLDPMNASLHFNYAYTTLTTNVPVKPEGATPNDFTSFSCFTDWAVNCRIVINYERHIQPLWDKDRFIDNEGNPVLDAAMQPATYRCTFCHNTVDETVVAAPVTRVPASQLDLTFNGPADDPDLYTSFQELLQNDNAQFIDQAGIVTDVLKNQNLGNVDVNGNPVFEAAPLPLPPNLAILEQPLDAQELALYNFPDRSVTPNNGSRNDGRLLNRMTQVEAAPVYPTNPDHSKMLSPIELRLITEWIDMGGRYYQDPFDVP